MVNRTLCMDPHTGLIESALYRPTPHYNERPPQTTIDTIVIHGISLPPGEFGGEDIEAFFCGQLDPTRHPYYASIAHLKVSAHLLIKRRGDLIQFVPLHKRAWHSGESIFLGKNNCNDFSIGIELEGADHMGYEMVQYDQLASVLHLLMKTYAAITHDRIVGHEDIAPGRKTDPGPFFDWKHLKGMLE